MQVIRAGVKDEATPSSGDWLYLDVGFASKSRSCCLLVAGGKPQLKTFAEARQELLALTQTPGRPLNLVLEAPLSVAFGPHGNPMGRSIERRAEKTRYWYVGPGCSVMVSALYMIRTLTDADRARDIRLFEGFVSFKEKAGRSSHCDDVLRLQDVIRGNSKAGRIVSPQELGNDAAYRLESAFAVSGMDYGVPPVVFVEPS